MTLIEKDPGLMLEFRELLVGDVIVWENKTWEIAGILNDERFVHGQIACVPPRQRGIIPPLKIQPGTLSMKFRVIGRITLKA